MPNVVDEIKALNILKHNLHETKTSENKLTLQCELVSNILTDLLNLDLPAFSSGEKELLHLAQLHFKEISILDDVWPEIPENIEEITHYLIPSIFDNINKRLQDNERHKEILSRINHCVWILFYYEEINKLINRPDISDLISQILITKPHYGNVNVPQLIATPFQRLPRLKLFANQWVEQFALFDNSYPAKLAALSINRKFSRVLESLNGSKAQIEDHISLSEQNEPVITKILNLFGIRSTDTSQLRAQIDQTFMDFNQKIVDDVLQSFFIAAPSPQERQPEEIAEEQRIIIAEIPKIDGLILDVELYLSNLLPGSDAPLPEMISPKEFYSADPISLDLSEVSRTLETKLDPEDEVQDIESSFDEHLSGITVEDEPKKHPDFENLGIDDHLKRQHKIERLSHCLQKYLDHLDSVSEDKSDYVKVCMETIKGGDPINLDVFINSNNRLFIEKYTIATHLYDLLNTAEETADKLEQFQKYFNAHKDTLEKRRGHELITDIKGIIDRSIFGHIMNFSFWKTDGEKTNQEITAVLQESNSL